MIIYEPDLCRDTFLQAVIIFSVARLDALAGFGSFSVCIGRLSGDLLWSFYSDVSRDE